jgi:predicted DNA-binding transcriptional regulator AlpA
MLREENQVQTTAPDATALLNGLVQHGMVALVPRPVDHQPAAGSELMTTEEVAQLLGVDPSSVRRWRTATPRHGPAFIRLSERIVKYRREDVERWLASRRVDPEAA